MESTQKAKSFHMKQTVMDTNNHILNTKQKKVKFLRKNHFIMLLLI
jgi:hypothetical protein